jgi:4-alpha-glucanotransferase
VAQIQDYLGLGSEARINTPGTAEGNWRWRLLPGELTPELAKKIAAMTRRYGRG